MKRSWTFSGLNRLHGTASKTWHDVCPTSHEVQVCLAEQAQHAILRVIIHNNPTSLASESAWKALVLNSWLLLGRPAVNASEQLCTLSGCAIGAFFGLRIGLLSGPWFVPNVMMLRSRVRKVATLARTGEKGRALAAARNAPPVPVTEQIVQEIKSLYPADPGPPAPVPAPVSALISSEVAEHVPTTLR